MNIVLVAPRFPFPLDKGDRLTVHHLLRHLSQRHHVSLVCFLEPDQDPAWVDKIQPFCQEVVIVPLKKAQAFVNCAAGIAGRTPLQIQYYADPAMRRAVRELISRQQPDLLYAHTIRMGQYIEPYRQARRVLAMQISMTLNYRRLAERAKGLPSRIFHLAEYRKVRAFEGEYARKFDKILLISEHDYAAIRTTEPLNNVFFSPHGVDFDYFTADPSMLKEPESLVFTGNMSYAPNIDAALYFYHSIFPLVRKEVPQVTWSIVGADPTPDIERLGADPNVVITGRVPDLRVYMNRAQISIDPLRIGAGLQNKVLEGMSMALPMVVTSIANEGIQAKHNEHLLIGDTPDQFARHLILLLQNADERRRLGEAARRFIAENWSWEKHFNDLEAMFVELVSEPTTALSRA